MRQPLLGVLDRPTGARLMSSSSLQEPPVEMLSPRESKLQMQMICLLVANGEATSVVAHKLGIAERIVENTIATPLALEMIVRFQHDISPDPRVRLGKLASIALDVQTKLLIGPASENVKATVAANVLDRHMGKATQVIESRSMHFDLKDADAINSALKASQDKLKKIEDMQKVLAISVTNST